MTSPDYDYDYNDIITYNKTFINLIWVKKEWDYMILLTSLFLPLVIFGLFGNILVIYIIWKNRHIRTPTNLLIGNMAAADLLSILVHPWVVLTYDFFQNYQLGEIGCRGEAAMECSILIASVISMSAITYDRLTAIVLPKETRLTRNTAKIVMGVTWLVGIILSIPLALYREYKERQWLNFLEKYCTEQSVVINIYWYVIITVLVWIPLIIQLICYISIFIKLNKYEKIILRKLPQHQVGYKKKAAKMMFVVTVIFMICRTPFTVLIIYRHQLIQSNKIGTTNEVQNQVNGYYHSLWFTSKYLVFLNAALNPLIYGLTNEKFRRAFQITKLSKWMFPPQSSRPATIKPKELEQQKTKTLEESKEKKISKFFKKKPKKVVVFQVRDTSSPIPDSRTKIVNSRF